MFAIAVALCVAGTACAGSPAGESSWTPEMRARSPAENPGFNDQEPEQRHFRLEGVPGPQLLDYTEARDSEGHSELLGVVLYVGLGWILCPILFGVMAMKPSTKPIGIVLLVLWGIFFAAPRFLEFVALFVVLPGMIFVGGIKGILRQFK